MSQVIFLNPVVSAGPTLVGIGNGTLTVDRLTHFTLAQTYTITCIAKSPDTLFSVVGSLDGAVGIATVGTQFFDEDLKIFFTIQQGSTVFEVGDEFTLTTANGTDLNQENIDEYDELPQKNFGPGTLGVFKGDDNIRYSDDDLFAYLSIQGLKLTADAAGDGGNDITFQMLQYTPAVAASLVVQDLTYTADTPGAAGNSITIEYVGDGLAGFETVGVIGNAITVHMEGGVSTATQIKAAVDASVPASALVNVTITGVGGNFQATFVQTNLAGGADDIGLAGFEFVSVTMSAITVRIESGVSTATQVKAALDASVAASALISVSIIGNGADPQFPMSAPLNLAGGKNKEFALNHDEFSDSGDFVEGNANLLARDLTLLGGATIMGHTHIAEVLSLNDSNVVNDSGAAIPNVQQYINRLLQLRQLQINTSDNSWVRYLSNQIVFSADIEANFRSTGITNTISSADSPVSLADGESWYVVLNPSLSVTVSTFVSSSVSTNVNALRLATRVGSYLVWFNGIVQGNNELARLGSQVNHQLQVLSTLTEGGLFTHDSVTPGQITFTANLKLKPLGSSQIVTISSGTFTLADGEVAYINLDDPFITATKSIQTAALTTVALSGIDKYWLFFRAGTVVYSRNGTNLAQGETARIDNSGSTASATAESIMRRDSSANTAVNKLTVGTGASAGVDVSAAGDLYLGASVGANNVYIGGASSNVVIPGNLEVQGTTTTLNTATLDVEDTNITINKNGTNASSEGAGLTVDRTGTKGSLIYANAVTSRFKIGDLGSEQEIVTKSYYRAGSAALALDDTNKVVTFSSTLGTTNYRVSVQIVNTTDSSVQYFPVTVTAKSATGFTASWNNGTDSANYVLEYQALVDS